MSDIFCAKCREPWDAYGARNGDMDPDEYDQFRRGLGCPACHFGTVCIHCRGTGLEPAESRLYADCKTCFGSRQVFGWQAVLKIQAPSGVGLNQLGGAVWLGYGVTKVQLSPDLDSIPASRLLSVGQWEKRLDGWQRSIRMLCPDCATETETCHVCQGSRKFVAQGDHLLAAMASACEASDEDPIEIIHGYLGGI